MTIELLQESSIRYWCQRLRMPDEAADEFVRVAQVTQTNVELNHLFTELHETMAIRGEWRGEWDGHPVDPPVEAALGRSASLFYLLAYMSALPMAEACYQRMGVGMDLFDATMYDITFYLLQLSEVRGYWTFKEFGWIWLHLSCRLFRLGRLQFALDDFDWDITAFRHKRSGEIRLLCGTRFQLREDGYAEGAGGQPAQGETWQPVFEEREEGWYGNPIHPRGYALRQAKLLPRTEWEVALRKGDTILDMHIPRGTTFSADEIRDSLRQARAFFAHHFPERPYRACYCHTWFFTPQLQTLLSLESSIVRFQREFYLYPYPGKPNFLWTFVFGEKYPDRATAPRDTTLRRAVLDWLNQGKEIFDLPGVMFHGAEEWGTQPYVSAWEKRLE